MNHDLSIARGEAARRLLDDPLLKEALATVKESVRDAFFALPTSAEREREFLHCMDRARQQFEGVLTLLIHDCDVSKAELLAEAHTQARIDSINRRAANG